MQMDVLYSEGGFHFNKLPNLPLARCETLFTLRSDHLPPSPDPSSWRQQRCSHLLECSVSFPTLRHGVSRCKPGMEGDIC